MQFHQYYFFFAVLQTLEACHACLLWADSWPLCLVTALYQRHQRKPNLIFSGHGCGGDLVMNEVLWWPWSAILMSIESRHSRLTTSWQHVSKSRMEGDCWCLIYCYFALMCIISFTWKFSLLFHDKTFSILRRKNLYILLYSLEPKCADVSLQQALYYKNTISAYLSNLKWIKS